MTNQENQSCDNLLLEVITQDKIYRFKNHQLQNIVLPDLEKLDGNMFWYKNGLLHRKDGPAAIYRSGIQRWLKDGLLHREDGPAVIYINGEYCCYLNGIRYSFEDWLNELNICDEEKLLLILKYR